MTTHKKLSKLNKVSFYSLSAFLLIVATLSGLPGRVSAVPSLTQTMVRFDRLQTSTATTGTVCVKPTTVLAEASVLVVYPTGYTLGLAATFTVNTTNLAWPAGGTAWPGIGTATNVTSQTVTFPSTDLTVGTLYCFNWINSAAVQVKSSATSNNTGTVTTQTSVPAAIDTGAYTTLSLASDQIGVTASVPASFTFALSTNVDALGALSTGSVVTSSSAPLVTVNTNANAGWAIYVKDANTGLTSPTALYTIPSRTPGSNSTLSNGTEGYNLGATVTQTSGTGSPAATAPFVGSSLGQGGGLDTTLRTVVSSAGTANNAVTTLKDSASISGLTSAANDYADTIFVVGAASF